MARTKKRIDILNNIFLNSWHFGLDYDIGDASFSLEQEGIPFIKTQLKPSSSIALADFGCWTGRNIRLLQTLCEKSGEIFAIDTLKAFTELKKKVGKYKNIEFRNTGLLNTGLIVNSIDAAICWRVLHNILDLEELGRTLNELNRVLKINAPFVISVRSTRDGMINCSLPLNYRTYYNNKQREDLYFSRASIVSLFIKYGFHIHSIKEIEEIEEGEVIENKQVLNKYWMLFLTKRELSND